MQNDQHLQSMHSLILRNTLCMCDTGEKEINTFFRVRLRPNFKLSNHLYTLPWCLYRPRRKDFAADLDRLVLMTLTPMLSFIGCEVRFVTGPS